MLSGDFTKFEHFILWKFFVVNMVYFVVSFYLSQEKGFTLDIQCYATYSSVLIRSQVAAIWNFDPNYSLSNVTQVSLPKIFQIVATWLEFSTEE